VLDNTEYLLNNVSGRGMAQIVELFEICRPVLRKKKANKQSETYHKFALTHSAR
jgi:hypothetical protein